VPESFEDEEMAKKCALAHTRTSKTGHQHREGPALIERNTEVAEVGIGLPLTLEFDMEVRGSGLRSESGTPATCTTASVKGRSSPLFEARARIKTRRLE
jgi:hypothetical protein